LSLREALQQLRRQRGVPRKRGPPAATHLIFLTQPSDAAAGAKITPPVRVAAEDDQDRVVTTFSGTISIAIGQNGSLLVGHLNGTTSVAAVTGVATFTDLSIDQAGISDYTLVASGSPLASAQSAPFKVTGPDALPRCTLSELSDAAATCWLCGYSGGTVAVEEAPTPERASLTRGAS